MLHNLRAPTFSFPAAIKKKLTQRAFFRHRSII
jgi:hypothetical protein